jgi:UDP-glucose 4-epimerase
VRAFQSDGWRVRAIVRSDPPVGILGDVDFVRGDLRDPESLRRAVEGVDAVVHMAGMLHIVFARPDHDEAFQRLNVDATRTLVDASYGKPFVFFSSIAVYGSGGPFDETSPVRPANAYARTKLEAERAVLDARGTVLRLAAVYGPRLKGNYASLVRFPFVIGGARNHRTLVHDSDVGRATVLALENEKARGEIYNVTDGTTHELREIIHAISPHALHVPLFLARSARILPRLRRLLDKYAEEVRVDGSKIQRDLGFRPRAEFASAWREAVRR